MLIHHLIWIRTGSGDCSDHLIWIRTGSGDCSDHLIWIRTGSGDCSDHLIWIRTGSGDCSDHLIWIRTGSVDCSDHLGWIKTRSGGYGDSQNSGHLIIPRISKSTASGRSFFYLAPKLWNNLPNTVREADTLCQFKSRLKTHLFNLMYT